MDGLVYTIDKLGRALADAEQALMRVRQENAALQARLEQREPRTEDKPENASAE